MSIRPFLKWAGGKYALLPSLLPLLPAAAPRLIEPFVGSGAVFLNTNYPAYLLADANPDLIGVYQALQRNGEAFIADCAQLFTPANNTPQAYYQLRARFNASQNQQERAVLFVYLNRHGYNGLCRYNSRGGFNVPFGAYKQPYFPKAEMQAFYAKAQRAEFVCAGYADTLLAAQPGDAVYCDPPYYPLTATASFTAYAPGGFSQADQSCLAQMAQTLAAKGVFVLVSNHDTPFTRNAYAGASSLTALDVRRFISCKGAQRGHAPELLAAFG